MQPAACGGEVRFAPDSPLEESGFELLVPSGRSVARQECQPLFPLCRPPRVLGVLGKARSPMDMFQGVSIADATSAMHEILKRGPQIRCERSDCKLHPAVRAMQLEAPT